MRDAWAEPTSPGFSTAVESRRGQSGIPEVRGSVQGAPPAISRADQEKRVTLDHDCVCRDQLPAFVWYMCLPASFATPFLSANNESARLRLWPGLKSIWNGHKRNGEIHAALNRDWLLSVVEVDILHRVALLVKRPKSQTFGRGAGGYQSVTQFHAVRFGIGF